MAPENGGTAGGDAVLPQGTKLFRACVRRNAARLLILAGAALGALCVSPALQATPATLRVMTWNIFAGNDLQRQSNLARIAALMDSLHVDVVLLQEVDRGTARSGGVDQAAVLAADAGMHVVFGASMSFDGGEYGNAILSRWPIQLTRVVPLQAVDPRPEAAAPTAAAPTAAPPTAAAPTSAQPTEPRSLLHVVVSTPAGPLHVLNTHVDHRAESHARRSQVLEILAYVASAVPRDARAVFGGDLNASPDTEEVRSLAAVFSDVWSSCGAGDGYTFRSDAPDRRIDYVMTLNILCKSAKVLDTQLSDHRPVMVDVPWALAYRATGNSGRPLHSTYEPSYMTTR